MLLNSLEYTKYTASTGHSFQELGLTDGFKLTAVSCFAQAACRTGKSSKGRADLEISVALF